MKIFPAIDLYSRKAVRLYKGDYDRMTVYSDSPVDVARDFKAQGAEYIHLVDLEGAKDGSTKNLETIEKIVKSTDLFAEVGGGIRSIETIEKYISVGVGRVILGTAAVENRAFLEEALSKYGDKVAVGVDIKDGFVAVSGWRERTAVEAMSFCRELDSLGVRTIISTDISRDGAMQGANHSLYERLSCEVGMNVIASGGVSDISDVTRLRDMKLYGAIIGKAYYTGAISLREAIEVANDN
ncbi:MAG: 1-(5-phosphoribosyl)-5-[Clostridia bacterium]|nr:1-(5-phosphoribosyl)-5-[(5-phosphoribosylamino)methylideneamino]imidazole-4-carboxamide isomerase [Clostridia bacterium]